MDCGNDVDSSMSDLGRNPRSVNVSYRKSDEEYGGRPHAVCSPATAFRHVIVSCVQLRELSNRSYSPCHNPSDGVEN